MKQLTPEQLNECFDDLISTLVSEIEYQRQIPQKYRRVRKFQSLANQARYLKKYTMKNIQPRNNTKRKCGFLKPVKVSDEMIRFLNLIIDDRELELKNGDSIPRNQINKLIHTYIVENKLYNPDDKRQIIPDDRLAKLIKFEQTEDQTYLTYSTIQSYLKKSGHYLS